MLWQEILNPEIQRFITENEKADIRELALKPMPFSETLRPAILDQIKARQKAKTKIPGWHNTDNVVFPPPDIIEQASSQATALYKAGLLQGKTFIDLTGGCGVDTAALAQNFEAGFCMEQDEDCASLLEHNLSFLTRTPIDVRHETAESFVQNMPHADLVYIDPQRRSGERKGLYNLEDCQPNVFHLLPFLNEKAAAILIKTSPVLDISKTAESLSNVVDIHVVEYLGDCKEVLYLCKPDAEQTTIHAVSIDENGQVLNKLIFTRDQETETTIEFSEPLAFIYEPGPAFMKSGGFKTLAIQYGLKKLHPSTHLYTSEDFVDDFPGRSFKLINILPADKKAVASALPDKKANITVRNFPATPDELRKQLKLRDGGPEYLFACTTTQNKHVLLQLRKHIL